MDTVEVQELTGN
jgi:hypothetical protein